MTEETADQALKIVFRSPNPAIKIEFQGGEPLLNFDLIRYVVLKAKKINEVEKRDLQFVITTTLSLITDEILDFCKEHKIFLSSSLEDLKTYTTGIDPDPAKIATPALLKVCKKQGTN